MNDLCIFDGPTLLCTPTFRAVSMGVVHLLAAAPLASLVLPARKAVFALVAGAAGAVIGALLTPPHAVFAGTVLAFALAWAAAVDLDRFILPDILTLGLVFLGLCFALAGGLAAARPYIFGAIAGYVALAGVAWFYRRVRKRNGLGLGDAKLLAAAGAWLGWAALPFVILIASITCLVSVIALALIQKRSITAGYVPFGPYLAGAIWILWLVQMCGRT